MEQNIYTRHALRDPLVIDVECVEISPVKQRLSGAKLVMLVITLLCSSVCVAAAFGLVSGPFALLSLAVIAGALKLTNDKEKNHA